MDCASTEQQQCIFIYLQKMASTCILCGCSRAAGGVGAAAANTHHDVRTAYALWWSDNGRHEHGVFDYGGSEQCGWERSTMDGIEWSTSVGDGVPG